MNIIHAAQFTVKNYPGGAEALATCLIRVDEDGEEKPMSAAVLRSKVNPKSLKHHLTWAEASQIMDVTGDHRMLHALAAEHGYTLQPMGASNSGTVMGAMLETAASQGAFAQAIQDALSDGLITENEMRAISAAGAAQMGAVVSLLGRLRSVTGVPGVGA